METLRCFFICFICFYMFLTFDVYDNQTLRTYSFSPIRLWTTPFWFWLEMFAKYLLHKKYVLIWTKLEVLEKWCEIVCQLSRGADIHYFLLLCSHSLPPLAPSVELIFSMRTFTIIIMTMIIVMRKTTHVDDVFIRERLVGLVVLCVLQENLQIVSSFTRIIIL